jgi:hypothetical protein
MSFIAPKIISPFFPSNSKIPRKLKKKIKVLCRLNCELLDNGQKLWYYLGTNNKKYRDFLITKICENENR